MRGLKMESSGFESSEESLNAPTTGVIPQRRPGSRVGHENEQLTISQTSGNDMKLSPQKAFEKVFR